LTRARDVANVLSTATSLATDTETAAAISSHNTAANGHTTRGNTAGRPATPTTGDVYINTETGFAEIYTGATYGWEQVGGIASTPTSVVATNSGSGRAFNNGSASVAFSAGTVLGRTYTVTSSPGSYTATGSTSPLVVTGLQSSTQYTYTVTATNNYGTSSASSASSAVTATTVPQNPTIGTATADNQSATLTFTTGATGGSSITNYKYSTDNSTYIAFSPAQTSSPLTISGLTNGTSYSFYLKAVNANGDSAASGQSNSITPAILSSFESIETITVGSGGSSTITFSSIPSTYKHLQIRGVARSNVGADNTVMRFNGDSGNNYSTHYLVANGGTSSAGNETSTSRFYVDILTANSTGNFWSADIIDILDYTSTAKNKTARIIAGQNLNNSNSGTTWLASGLYFATPAAITTVTLTTNSGAGFAQHTSFALYGIKG
jgi:hypothetical protein